MNPAGLCPRAVEVYTVGPLSPGAYGELMMDCDRKRFELSGRDAVSNCISNFAYVPRDASHAFFPTARYCKRPPR